MTDSQQLLADYVENGSETAFRELVTRYVDLVYSAAVRLVNSDRHLAEDVTQTVFADLAREARKLSRQTMLGGWLHRHTCFVASKVLRTERRRLARERQAVEMNALEDHSAENFSRIAPILDDAINQLGADDRAAILSRFFEQKDFRTVGEALGSTEEAARKRVDRALEKLELLLKRRGVALSATALATTLTAQVVSAAPVGLAVSISSVALAGAATGAGTAITFVNIMSMTKLKIGIITVVVAAGVTVPLVMQHQAKTRLREANAELQRKDAEVQQLAAEKARLASEAANAQQTKPAAPSSEVLKMRAEISRLNQENASARAAAAAPPTGPSALSGLKENPGMWKVIRDQQKAGLSMIYKDFIKRANLPKEQGEKLNELLADNVMENIDRITEVLRDGKSPQEMEQVFAAQEAALQEKVQSLIGAEAFAQYQDYTKNLASLITAEQFKGMLSGDKDAKEGKSKQLYEVLQAESQATLASASLPADFQTVPTLNFRNFASDAAAERNLQLLDGIYERATAKAGSFLSPEDINKFTEFRTNAINANRMSLALNRKMMAPGHQIMWK